MNRTVKKTLSYKSLPHRIRRVFERRSAQKPDFQGVRRFAKRNWNRRTQRYPSHPGQGVTGNDSEKIQDSLASPAPMRSMGSRLRDARKGIIFRTAHRTRGASNTPSVCRSVYSSSRDCTHDEVGFRRRLLPAYPTTEVTGIAR